MLLAQVSALEAMRDRLNSMHELHEVSGRWLAGLAKNVELLQVAVFALAAFSLFLAWRLRAQDRRIRALEQAANAGR